MSKKEKDEFPPENEHPQEIQLRTARDAKFIRMFEASGFDFARKGEIAAAAGFPPGEVARGNAGRILKSLAHNKSLQRALKREGVDDKKLAKKVSQLLDCEHPAFPGRADNMVQLKATEMAVRIKDAFPPTKVEVDKSERREIIISGEVIGRLEKYENLKMVDVDDVTVTDSCD